MKRLASVVVVGILVLLVVLPVSAQDGGAGGDLQVITAQNLDQLTQIARLGRGSLWAVTWSPEGTTLVASGSGGAWLYDPVDITADPVLLADTAGGASNAVYSADGALLAVGSAETVQVWDVAAGEVIATLDGGGSLLAWSPDGSQLVTGWNSIFLALWDVATGEQVAELAHLRMGEISAMAYSPDGAWIAWGDSNGVVTVWDVAAGETVATLQHDSETVGAILVLPIPVLDVAFSPDSATLVTLTNAETNPLPKGVALRYWDIADLSEPRELVKDGLITLWQIDYTVSGALVGIGEAGGEVGLWNMTSGKVITSLAADYEPSRVALALSPDGTQLAVGTYEGAVDLWDLGTGDLIAAVVGHAVSGVAHVAFDPVHGRVATQSTNQIMLWDLASGELLFSDYGLYYSVALSPGGDWLLAGSYENVLLFNLGDVLSGAVEPVDSGKIHVGSIEDAVFSPDGSLLATGCLWDEDCTVAVWDWATGEIIERLGPINEGARRLAFAGDESRLLLGMDILGGRIGVWDVTHVGTTGADVVQVFGEPDEYGFNSFALDPSGALLVASQQFIEDNRPGDSMLSVWDIQSGRHLTDWGAPDAWYQVLGFTPDGTQVLVNGGEVEDACLHVYSVATGAVLGATAVCPSFVSPDGTLLVSTSYPSNTLTVWGVPVR